MALFNLKYPIFEAPHGNATRPDHGGPDAWAGHRPKLCNPFEEKRRMGLTHKTDKLDARGLAVITPHRLANPCTKYHRGVFR